MEILIVYDSFFGNTEKIARSIASAYSGHSVRIIKAGQDGPAHTGCPDILIAGSPTRAFKPVRSVTECIKKIPAGTIEGIQTAAFDTRIPYDRIKPKILGKIMSLLGYAAGPLGKMLVKKGGIEASGPEGFIVMDSEGPLRDGEEERARQWAGTLTS